MRIIFRNIINFGDGVHPDALKQNFLRFLESRLDYSKPDTTRDLARFLIDFNKNYRGEIPNVETICDYFEQSAKPEVVEYVRGLKEEKVFIRADFEQKIAEEHERQREAKFTDIISNTALIRSQGIKVDFGGKGGKKFIKGINEAVKYFVTQADSLTRVTSKSKLSGHFNADRDEAIQDHETARINPPIGELMGIDEIDRYCLGLKRGEMMLIGGFTGELKTTLALNYAWMTAFWYGKNVYYASLEMRYEVVRRILAAIHSSHYRFTSEYILDPSDPARQRMLRNPQYSSIAPLSYAAIRDGKLNDEQQRLFQIVWDDITIGTECGDYGRIFIDRPDDKAQVTISELRFRAEKEHAKNPLSLIIVDHGGLVDFEGGRKAGATGEALNFVLRDASQLALNFDNGNGIAVCMPFQINRQGKKEAEKNEGVYKMDALSYASEAERSSSVIITTYLDNDLRTNNEVKIGCLKNRDNPLFPAFTAKIDFPSRRIKSLVPQMAGIGVKEVALTSPDVVATQDASTATETQNQKALAEMMASVL